MDIDPLIAKIRVSHTNVEKKLSDPSVFSDRENYENLSREYQRLSQLLSSSDEAAKLRDQLSEN